MRPRSRRTPCAMWPGSGRFSLSGSTVLFLDVSSFFVCFTFFFSVLFSVIFFLCVSPPPPPPACSPCAGRVCAYRSCRVLPRSLARSVRAVSRILLVVVAILALLLLLLLVLLSRWRLAVGRGDGKPQGELSGLERDGNRVPPRVRADRRGPARPHPIRAARAGT